jgi:hypothetical protein
MGLRAMKKITLIFSLLFLQLASASEASSKKDNYDLWPRIPFNISGVNLCNLRGAYSQNRSEYMAEMVSHAENLLYACGENCNFDPADTLSRFNSLYEKNLAYATKGLGVTLEATFKSYLESYYRKLKPRTRKLRLKFLETLDTLINNALRGNQVRTITRSDSDKIDLFAFGTYSMSPRCNGNIVVTLTIVNREGVTKEYMGTGRTELVMSQIASRVFEDYQRTKFPARIKVGTKYITLLGGLNGNIDSTMYLDEAKKICETLGARLPTDREYKMINSYGSWSGGITLGRRIWAMNYPNVFVPYFQRSPVRTFSQVNDKTYYYTCIK